MLSQSTYLFAAKIAGYGIRILLPAFLVRALTKADFGSYNQFFLIEVLFQTIFQLGVNQALFFFVPKDAKNAGGFFVNGIILNLGLFLVSYSLIGVFRTPIASYLKMPILEELFWHLAAYTVLLMLTVCAATYIQAKKLIRESAVFEIGTQIIVSIATLAAAFTTRDLPSIIVSMLVARAVCMVGIMVYIQAKLNGFASERYFCGLGSQVKYGVMLGISGMLWTFMTRMHELSVSKFFDLETYAVYSAGCKQIPILLFFTQSITPVALVKFAQLEADGDWKGIQEFWNKVLSTMFGFGIPLTLLFILVAKPLVTLMFTPEYSDAILVFQLGAVAALFQLWNPSRILRAMDRNDVMVKVHAGILILLPGALYLGKSIAGVYGIIGAHACMAIASRLVAMVALNRLAPVPIRYVPPWASVRDFYRNSFVRGKSWLLALRR